MIRSGLWTENYRATCDILEHISRSDASKRVVNVAVALNLLLILQLCVLQKHVLDFGIKLSFLHLLLTLALFNQLLQLCQLLKCRSSGVYFDLINPMMKID